MIALLIKELRENLKWAALAAALLCCLLAWAISNDLNTGLSLVGTTMGTISCIAFPAMGFAMGLLAILPDARQGRWQFLVHRPIDRRKIFDCKMLVSAGLYLASTLPPLLATYAWAATPGHIPGPVTPDLLLPRLADLLGGLLWLAAGLLIASRSARWIGSRLVPIGFALIVNVLAIELSMEFVEFLLMIGCGTALLIIAARCAFGEGGELPRHRWAMRTFTGISLAAGWTVVFSLAVALADALLGTILPVPQIMPGKYYALLDDGQIAITGVEDSQATYLDGTPIVMTSQPLNRHMLARNYLQLQGQRPEDMGWGERQMYWGFHSAWAHLRRFTSGQTGYSWFYIVSRNTIDGFDPNVRSYRETLSASGFSVSPQPFPETLFKVGALYSVDSRSSGSMLTSEKTVWRVDFDHREVRRIFIAPGGDEVLDAAYLYPHDQEDPDRVFGGTNAVATRQAVYIFKDNQAPLRLAGQFQYPDYNGVYVGRTKDGHLVLDYLPQSNVDHPAQEIVIFADADGTVQKQVPLPKLPDPQVPERMWEEALQFLAAPPAFLAAMLPFNPVESPHGRAIAWADALCAAIIAAALTVPLARRRQFSPSSVCGWAALNLLLGFPGLLLLVSMDDAVPTVRCESCGNPRPITREQCPHCAAGFSPPARTGIEIFAPA